MKDPLVYFKDISLLPDHWHWDFGTGDSSFLQHPSYAFEEPGIHRILLTIENEAGCPDTISKRIFVYPESFIKLPTAFTPNNDGENDELKMFFAGILELEILRIYNRWGELVFETNNLEDTWDGTFRGKPQDTGTYVYYLVGRPADSDEKIFQKGNITLIR
ncbi:MAG: gliding motility-associated C-terminal domain-containing protein [Bacteroidetes bacterium]|nr:gliding motility-associated C-terminal domain-containing protein [Bacteroidota bacterium]